MAEVISTFQLTLGASAPEFCLPDGFGREFSLSELSSGKKATVIIFACNHCPFVVHLAEGLAKFHDDYAGKGVQMVAINSNDIVSYPADSPEKMVQFATSSGWRFPYLLDEDQAVAKAYAAACTPDFYVFDQELKLSYAGQFDASRPGRAGAIDGIDLRTAVDATILGQEVPMPWQPSSGCNIKWKSGNEPAYFG